MSETIVVTFAVYCLLMLIIYIYLSRITQKAQKLLYEEKRRLLRLIFDEERGDE